MGLERTRVNNGGEPRGTVCHVHGLKRTEQKKSRRGDEGLHGHGKEEIHVDVITLMRNLSFATGASRLVVRSVWRSCAQRRRAYYYVPCQSLFQSYSQIATAMTGQNEIGVVCGKLNKQFGKGSIAQRKRGDLHSPNGRKGQDDRDGAPPLGIKPRHADPKAGKCSLCVLDDQEF